MAIFLWSIAYTTIYLLFVLSPDIVSVSQLMTAKVIAPLFGVWLSGDFRQDSMTAGKILLILIKFLFLLAIIYTMSGPHALLTMPILFITIGFSLQQSMGRVISKVLPGIAFTPVFGLCNGLFILLALYVVHPAVTLQHFNLPMSGILILAVAILLTQVFQLYGFKHAPPYVSTVFIAASIPIAIVVESAFEQSAIRVIPLMLSMLYLVIATVSILPAQAAMTMSNMPSDETE